MTAQTVSYDGMTYGLDEMGQVKWATYTPEAEKPEAGLAPFWWESRPVNADAAHEATMAMARGMR
jgi:hypothetical protein